jgi:cell division protein FtsB
MSRKSIKALSSTDKFNNLDNQGLKKSRWPVSWIARLSLLIIFFAAFAVLYLVQSSQLVTMSRHVDQLHADLVQLQQDNAQLALQISAAGSVDRLYDRAEKLGFVPAEEIVYLQVKSQPIDDAPTIESAFGH